MKPFSKIIYRTDNGKIFKTIAPVITSEAFTYMKNHYGAITILSCQPSVKRNYKKYSNIYINK